MLKQFRFWEILVATGVPLIMVFTQDLPLFHLVYFFVFQGMLLLALAAFKHMLLAQQSNSSTGFGPLFFLIHLVLNGMPLIILIVLLQPFYGRGDLGVMNVLDPVFEEPILYGFAGLKVVWHQIQWVREKKHTQYIFDYIAINGVAHWLGMIVFFGLTVGMGELFLSEPLVIGILVTILVLFFELLNEFMLIKLRSTEVIEDE